MKENNITLQAINVACNKTRHQSEGAKKIAEIAKKYAADVDTDINAELAGTVRLAKVRAIIAYVNAKIGVADSPYIVAIDKALNDDVYAQLCASTTDVTSVEWFVGRVFAASTSDVADVLKKILGSQVKSLGKQIKRLANCIANSGMYDADDFAGAQLSVTRINIATLYGKRYPILSDDKILSDVCTITYYLLRK